MIPVMAMGIFERRLVVSPLPPPPLLAAAAAAAAAFYCCCAQQNRFLVMKSKKNFSLLSWLLSESEKRGKSVTKAEN